jgi:hypothetical protein
MEHPHTSLLLPLFLAQSVFGLLYALLIHWISVNDFLKGSTAWSVVIGDAATLLIQWLFIRDNWHPLVTFGSFAFTGLPMVVTYLYRYQRKVLSHKRRPWPTAALNVRNNAVMDITKMIADIEVAAKDNAVTAGFLLGVVNKLHYVKKILTSV